MLKQKHVILSAVLLVFLIPACSNSNDNIDTTDTLDLAQSTEAIFQDSANPLVALLNTGSSSNESSAYWNCMSDNMDGDRTENIHLRLWLNGLGISASSNVNWQVLSETAVQVEYDDGEFQLQNIAFSTTELENDYFSAQDSAGGNIQCNRVGPLGGQNQQLILSDGSSGQNPLQAALSSPSPATWNCELSEDGIPQENVSYQLHSNGAASVNSEPARWFVDTRSKVLISTKTDIHVLRDVVAEENNVSFIAGLNQYDLSCDRLIN